MSESTNLVQGLTDEILRVTEIRTQYLALPRGAGAFAAALMQHDLEAARQAQASGDILEMISALKKLQEYEL